MKALVLALLLPAFSASAQSHVSWVLVLTAHNSNGALVAVDTEGPFKTEAECKAVGAAVTKRVYEVIGSFQPDTHSALDWDKLTTSCEEAVSPVPEGL